MYVRLEPAATAVKVVLSPSQTVRLVGCVVITGLSRTVIFLVKVFEVPQGLETFSVNV